MPDDSARVVFDIITPVDTHVLRANVKHALSLGLPELGPAFERTVPLSIVANGPSAKRAPHALPARTLALNGAMLLWLGRTYGPTWWAACDPQPLVADFLPANPPGNTVYLVASKCDPRVFEKLRGCNVVLWHVDEPCTRDLLLDRVRVTSGVSITLCALELGALLGFRDFDMFGWDGCFGLDGASHAGTGVASTERVTVALDDRQWATTHTWALELQDAQTRIIGFPFPIRIHGDGMFGAVLADFLPHRVSVA